MVQRLEANNLEFPFQIIFEAQEETISHLKQQLQTKDELVAALQAKLASEINRNKVLTSVIR